MKPGTNTFRNEEESSDSKRKKQARIRINTEIKTALDQLDPTPKRRRAFLQLLERVRACTSLLKPTPGRGNAGWIAPVFLIKRLANLARDQQFWIRPCKSWTSGDGNLRPVFRSLARHLMADYPVPGFMDSVWDFPAGPGVNRQRLWFLRLGMGESLRTLDWPLSLTRKMAHYVSLAPEHFTISQALRHGEVRGLGGSKELTREIIMGRLGRSVEHPEFWRTVLHFFIAHPELDLNQVNPIIDYIQANKFGGEEIWTDDGQQRRPAPWPDFSIKGRSPQSIFRRVTAWHSDLALSSQGEAYHWSASGIQDYRYLEKRHGDDEQDRDWNITELLDSDALRAEGRRMHHCVLSYSWLCRQGKTTIWSLRTRIDGIERAMATIEINPQTRSIIQIRSKCNRRPGTSSRKIINSWAAKAGLSISDNA